jgi:SAM-dependent methyltransferase
VRTKLGLRGSRSSEYVGPGSQHIADILARCYELAIRAHATGRLLDMGCGHVPLYEAYRDLVTENICVDWENTLHPNQYLDMSVDLNGNLPFDDGSFDTILLTDVLEHVTDPMRLMYEIARLLRLNGKLIVGVPFFYWLHEEPHDYYRYTEYALRRFCQLSRLKIVDLEPYGGLPDILLDLTSKGVGLLPRSLAAFVRPLHTSVSLLSRTRLFKKLSKLSQSTFPLGYVLVAQKQGPEQ